MTAQSGFEKADLVNHFLIQRARARLLEEQKVLDFTYEFDSSLKTRNQIRRRIRRYYLYLRAKGAMSAPLPGWMQGE